MEKQNITLSADSGTRHPEFRDVRMDTIPEMNALIPGGLHPKAAREPNVKGIGLEVGALVAGLLFLPRANATILITKAARGWIPGSCSTL